MSVTLDVDEEAPAGGVLPDGAPDPAYAAALGLTPAPVGRRVAAFGIDAALIALLGLPVLLGTVPAWVGVYPEDLEMLIADPAFGRGLVFVVISQGLASVAITVQLITHGLRGVTLGKRMLGLRSVSVTRFAKPGFWRVVLRAIVLSLSALVVPVLGAAIMLASPLWDRERRGRGWLDLVSRSWLLDVRHGLDPFDAKALRHARKRVEAPAAAEDVVLPSLATATSSATPTFVPASRSSSGVVTAPGDVEPPAAWTPPPVGAPVVAAPPIDRRRPRSGPRPDAVLHFDDGTVVEVVGDGLVGRNPAPSPGEAPTTMIPLTDPTSLVSKTHAGFGVDDGGFWVMDRGSVNGTAVLGAPASRVALVAWQRTAVPWGATVEVGSRSFTAAPGDAGPRTAGPVTPTAKDDR